MSKKQKFNPADWLRSNRWALLVLALAAVLFFCLRLSLRQEEDPVASSGDYVEYEKGTVASILTDSSFSDPVSDNGWRGNQMLLVDVTSGQYAGEQLLVYNELNPLYGNNPVREGTGVVLTISTYSDGSHVATVFENNRIPALCVVIGLFFVVTILVGRKTGAKSLVSLVITILCLFYILIPLLLRGAPTLLTVFMTSVYITVVSFTILGGVGRKSLCAMLGTIAGTAFAMFFAMLAQALCQVSGLRMTPDVDPLLQLRQTGTPIGLRGLLVAGVIISALGAVMDVAMSISSALEEVHAADPSLGFKRLFRSGMNIGQDMVGTMTNTLILAFLGSSFVFILYIYSMGLSHYQLFSSAYLSIEVISGISSSVGMILAIPLTAAVSAMFLSRRSAGNATPLSVSMSNSLKDTMGYFGKGTKTPAKKKSK